MTLYVSFSVLQGTNLLEYMLSSGTLSLPAQHFVSPLEKSVVFIFFICMYLEQLGILVM